MCPACVASAAAVVTGSVMSTGGLAAIAVKIFRSKKNLNQTDSQDAKRGNGDHEYNTEQR
jgi:hypothetical protein